MQDVSQILDLWDHRLELSTGSHFDYLEPILHLRQVYVLSALT